MFVVFGVVLALQPYTPFPITTGLSPTQIKQCVYVLSTFCDWTYDLMTKPNLEKNTGTYQNLAKNETEFGRKLNGSHMALPTSHDHRRPLHVPASNAAVGGSSVTMTQERSLEFHFKWFLDKYSSLSQPLGWMSQCECLSEMFVSL